jgi:hypothetical protein
MNLSFEFPNYYITLALIAAVTRTFGADIADSRK